MGVLAVAIFRSDSERAARPTESSRGRPPPGSQGLLHVAFVIVGVVVLVLSVQRVLHLYRPDPLQVPSGSVWAVSSQPGISVGLQCGVGLVGRDRQDMYCNAEPDWSVLRTQAATAGAGWSYVVGVVVSGDLVNHLDRGFLDDQARWVESSHVLRAVALDDVYLTKPSLLIYARYAEPPHCGALSTFCEPTVHLHLGSDTVSREHDRVVLGLPRLLHSGTPHAVSTEEGDSLLAPASGRLRLIYGGLPPSLQLREALPALEDPGDVEWEREGVGTLSAQLVAEDPQRRSEPLVFVLTVIASGGLSVLLGGLGGLARAWRKRVGLAVRHKNLASVVARGVGLSERHAKVRRDGYFARMPAKALAVE